MIFLIIRKIIRNYIRKKNKIFWPKKDKFCQQKRRKEHSISFHQVEKLNSFRKTQNELPFPHSRVVHVETNNY
jgi:hypothetical protein